MVDFLTRIQKSYNFNNIYSKANSKFVSFHRMHTCLNWNDSEWVKNIQNHAKIIRSSIHNDWLGLKGVEKDPNLKLFAINQLCSKWIRHEPWSITEYDSEVVFIQSIIPYLRFATVRYEILLGMNVSKWVRIRSWKITRSCLSHWSDSDYDESTSKRNFVDSILRIGSSITVESR